MNFVSSSNNINSPYLLTHQTFDQLQDSYLPSPVRRVNRGTFRRLQERWEQGNVIRQSSSDSLLEILGGVHLKEDGDEDEPTNDVIEVTEEEEETPEEPSKSVDTTERTTLDHNATQKRKPKKSVTFSIPEMRVYPVWEFGKRKNFRIPQLTNRNQEAAIQIQRIARGGMQRLHYKILRLNYLLETRHERTNAAIAKIHDRSAQRKNQFLTEIEQQNRENARKAERYVVVAHESQKIVEFLRKSNKEQREKLEKYNTANSILREQNDRLLKSKNLAEGTFWSLNDHAKTILETHTKLKVAIKRYQERVLTLQTLIEDRITHGKTEHRIKLKYMQTLGEMAVRLEETPGEEEIAQRVTHLVVLLEGMEVSTPATHSPSSPRKQKVSVGRYKQLSLGEHLGRGSCSPSNIAEVPFEIACMDGDEEDESEDDSVDHYTVHTMNFNE